MKGNEFIFSEVCDYCFETIITKDQMVDLAHEILELAGEPLK
jgi:hypothetical protein